MPGPASQTSRGRAERLLAWAFTGPIGHFYSVVVDLVVFAARSLGARGRRRVRRALSR